MAPMTDMGPRGGNQKQERDGAGAAERRGGALRARGGGAGGGRAREGREQGGEGGKENRRERRRDPLLRGEEQRVRDADLQHADESHPADRALPVATQAR